MDVEGAADRAAEAVTGSDAADRAGRIGLATRGALYLISAALTVRIALSRSSDEGPGSQGALKAVAEQPFGRVLVAVMAVGLAGYAGWRLVSAFAHQGDDDESEIQVWTTRAVFLGRALAYFAVLGLALSLVIGGSGSSQDGQSTARIFDLPAGRWIVLAIGVGLLTAAVHNGYRAFTENFSDNWRDDLSADEVRWASRVASAGLLGHALVFALVGFFLTRSAIEFDPSEPEGLDEAVRALADEPGGTAAILLVALGMAAYAAFNFVESGAREILE